MSIFKRKTHVIPFDDFMRGDFNRGQNKTRIVLKIVGTVAFFLIVGLDDSSYAFAAEHTSIDAAGRAIYYKLTNIGKWIIIFKGGIDTIKSISNGDIDGAKKSFLTYTLAYLLLLALPWSFDTVDDVFNDLSK